MFATIANPNNVTRRQIKNKQLDWNLKVMFDIFQQSYNFSDFTKTQSNKSFEQKPRKLPDRVV